MKAVAEWLRRYWFVAIAWPGVVFFVLPHLPTWLQGTAYAAVFGYACYTWGRLAEHKRRIQDALRYGEELARFHEMMIATFDHLREGIANVDVAFAKLEKAAKPKASEIN